MADNAKLIISGAPRKNRRASRVLFDIGVTVLGNVTTGVDSTKAGCEIELMPFYVVIRKDGREDFVPYSHIQSGRLEPEV
jgi:hypothetical protein